MNKDRAGAVYAAVPGRAGPGTRRAASRISGASHEPSPVESAAMLRKEAQVTAEIGT